MKNTANLNPIPGQLGVPGLRADTRPGPLPPELWPTNSRSPHQAESPWARTPPASAAAALLELSAKIFTPEERRKMQTAEDECAGLDAEWAAHVEHDFDNEIWHLFNDATDKLTTAERVAKLNAIETEKANIPTWRKEIDDKYQRAVRRLLPFATRLLKALAVRIYDEIKDISKNGTGGRSKFWSVGTDDETWILWPLARLHDFTLSHIAMCEKYEPQNGWLLRQSLIDAGAITQRAKLNRG